MFPAVDANERELSPAFTGPFRVGGKPRADQRHFVGPRREAGDHVLPVPGCDVVTAREYRSAPLCANTATLDTPRRGSPQPCSRRPKRTGRCEMETSCPFVRTGFVGGYHSLVGSSHSRTHW